VAKRQAVIDAAAVAFLERGYDSVTMDEIAEASSVAKQTVYTYFGTKESLFVELVASMTRAAGDRVHLERPSTATLPDLIAGVRVELRRQLDVVLTPALLRLRRLVIGEQSRFPALARALAEEGPGRAIDVLSAILGDGAARGLLTVPDPRAAAAQLNWLVMGGPLNDAMLLGDQAVLDESGRDAHLDYCLDMFFGYHTPTTMPASTPGDTNRRT